MLYILYCFKFKTNIVLWFLSGITVLNNKQPEAVYQ